MAALAEQDERGSGDRADFLVGLFETSRVISDDGQLLTPRLITVGGLEYSHH
jgi:hypothetical protein